MEVNNRYRNLLTKMNLSNRYKINVRENQRGNQEWAIQRYWQHWAHRTQDEDKQNTTQQRKLTRC